MSITHESKVAIVTGAPGGAIVNVASMAGLGATGVLGWYAVSKATLIPGRRRWLR